jgi:branched-chain amino acid transport system ATP-binding protein
MNSSRDRDDREGDLLHVDGLDASYGQVRVLNGMAVELNSGEVRVLLGANGAGKSTFLKAILGLVRIQAGTIVYDRSTELRGLATDTIHRLGIAWVPQGRQTFASLSVLDNLRIGSYSEKDKKAVGPRLDKIFELFPVLRQRAKQLAGSLSGGEQQALSIARALMSAPRLMLMDEPSLGLSPRVLEDVLQMILRIKADGISVLMVEQNARQALSVADFAYVLESGRVVASGLPRELESDDVIKRTYLGQ